MSNLRKNMVDEQSEAMTRAFRRAFKAKDSDHPSKKQATHVLTFNKDGSVTEDILPLRYFPSNIQKKD